jgi:hypothetical protein
MILSLNIGGRWDILRNEIIKSESLLKTYYAGMPKKYL